MKGDIHSFVLSTRSFLCEIGEPRYMQNKVRYQIKRIGYIEQENIDLAALKKFLSKNDPRKSSNSKSIISQINIFKQLKNKITNKSIFWTQK